MVAAMSRTAFLTPRAESALGLLRTLTGASFGAQRATLPPGSAVQEFDLLYRSSTRAPP